MRRKRIAVGSTGNLGLSIGLLAAAFGLGATVHMSVDARAWKKELLRSRGVEVIEHPGDFTAAVAAGRQSAQEQPNTHFVDDESSLSLFAGYAVAARRLAGQLAAMDITVDDDSPLIVYLPCGVGGGPGGVTYGLKQVFGDRVRCILVEPTGAPAMTLGVRSGLHSQVSVQDIGLNGKTTADGLAVGRPSHLVGEQVGDLFDGFMTVSDTRMHAMVAAVWRAQGWRVEPSAAAGVIGPWWLSRAAGFANSDLREAWSIRQAHHVVWSTGGSMVPEEEADRTVTAGSVAMRASLNAPGPVLFC